MAVERTGGRMRRMAGGVLVWTAVSAAAALADDLSTARTALQERLYPIAQAHAQRALLSAEGDRSEPLRVLVEALYEQGQPDEALSALDRYTAVVQAARDPGPFVVWRAQALLASGRPTEASRVAEDAVARLAPAYAEALLRIAARARRASGDLTGALALYAACDRTSTNAAVRAENALERALVLSGAGQAAEALDVLKAQADLGLAGPAADDGALLRGRLLLQLGKPADATRVLSQLAMNERASEAARVQALVEMSVFALNGGKTNEALAYARSAYERAEQPETRRLAGFRLGDLLGASPETIDEGEGIVKALVREFPEQPDAMQAQLKLADSLLQANRPERAATEYRIFLETYPSSSLDARVLQGRGWALLRLGRYTEAGGVFQRAAELASNETVRAECLFKQGDALLADGRFSEAAQAYARLADELPQAALADRARFQRADALERAGLRAEAAAAYRAAAVAQPEREVAPQALLRLAALQAASDTYDEALATYTEVLAVFPQRPIQAEALMGRGKVYYRTYRFEQAMQDFAAVAEGDASRRDEARFLLALCLYGLGRDKEAREAGAAFLLDFPESARQPDMTLWLGKLEFNRGRYAEARRRFAEYVARWPAHAWADAALLWAARAAFGEADFTGTVELVARLVREYPASRRLAEGRLVQADALVELARFAEAVLLLDQVMAQEPDGDWGAQARLRRGDCLFALGADSPQRYQEALAAYRELLTQPGLAPALTLSLNYKVGRCLEKMKRVDEAISQYYAEVLLRYQEERAHGGWTDDASASLYMRAAFSVADLFEQKGQPEHAVSVLQRAAQSGLPGEEEARHRIARLRKKRS